MVELYAIKKPYWVFDTPSPCLCCDPGHAMHDDNWECWVSNETWKVLTKEPDFTKEHDYDVCIGNCSRHPLIDSTVHPLIHPALYMTTWGEYSNDFEEASRALETEEERDARIQRELAELDKKRIVAEEQVRFNYSRDMHDKSMRGVRKDEAPKKYDRPCKWMVGKDRDDSIARGDLPCCWAWEFINPKTKKAEKPRSCMYQHPGEKGWRNEWSENHMWVPQDTNNRFANLLVHTRF